MVKYSITHKGVILFFFFLVTLLGYQSIKTIGKQENPEFPQWSSVIITRFPGASPLKVEELVTERIEKKMQEIPEFEKVTSTSKFGISYIFLKIDNKWWDVKPIWDKVRNKLDDLKGTLPEGVKDPWLNNDFGKTKSIVLAITGPGFSNKELSDVADDLKKEFEQVEYVARVDIIGEQEQRVFLEVSTNKMSELGMSAQSVVDIIRQQNILQPGGRVKLGPQRIRLETSGEFKSIQEIGNTLISVPGSPSSFFLKDLVLIKREYIDPPEMQMRYKGKPAIGLVIEMQDGGQIIEMGNNIKQATARFTEDLFHGININFINFQPKWTIVKIEEFVGNLVQAIGMVAVIITLLLGWRQGIIVSLLIPASYLITLIIMNSMEIPLHQISLAALIISLGMLVDNGIVMTESITDYINKGYSKEEAAIQSGKELFFPLLAATGTTVAAFSPIALARSGVGVYCNSLPYVIGTVLLASYFVAMTLIPILGIWLIKPKSEKENSSSLITKFYRKLMKICLNFRLLTILCMIALFFFVTPLGGFLKKTFFPPSGRGQFTIDMHLPEGTDFLETRKQAIKLEQYLLNTYPEEMDTFALYLGEGGPMFHTSVIKEQKTSNYAQFVINTNTYEHREKMLKELPLHFNSNYEDAILILKPIEEGPPVGAPLQVRVHGKDFEELYNFTQIIQDKIEKIPGTTGTRNDWGRRVPMVTLQVNQENARRVGISTESITSVLQTVFSGTEITNYREGNDDIPVMIRAIKPERTTLRKLENMKIPTSEGYMVPISQVTDRILKWETGKIKRYNQRRTITILAYSDGTRSPMDLIQDAQNSLSTINFPYGYGIEFGGELEESSKAQKSIVAKLPVGLAFLIMILVIQFGNVRKMLIILTTIPLSFIGVILGLYLMEYPISFFAQLGILSLAGIVVNNAILLIEQVDADLEAGKPPIEAIIHAGQRRAYPIFLTTITTVAGLFSLAVSGLLWGPLAIAIIGGLIVSTFLTLVVAPVLYALFFNIKFVQNSPEPN